MTERGLPNLTEMTEGEFAGYQREFNRRLGANIRTARLLRGLSLVYLHSLTKIHDLSRLERSRMVTCRHLVSIAEALGVEPVTLLPRLR